MEKREFLKSTAALGLGMLFNPIKANGRFEDLENNSTENETDFWEIIRKDYELNPKFINLENGYYCIQPQPILKAFQKHISEINKDGAYYMRTVQFENKQKVSNRLAEIAGCSAEELIITRNTTESLNMVISGFNWQAGDEVIYAEQDYGAMKDMIEQVVKRYGVVSKIVSIPNNPATDEEILSIYEKAFSSKTKLLLVSHIINITGHALPIKKICSLAKQKGIKTLVDGAHAFAHIQFKLNDLECDFYGCSLHKWLSAPLGAGFLYVKKENIGAFWPLFAESADKNKNNILSLNHTGTIPVHTDLAINAAIDYYNKIGADKKQQRLLFLRNYWVEKVKGLPNIIFNSPLQNQRACSIGNVGVKNITPAKLASLLMENYKIYTVAIDTPTVKGVRITPNVYTTTQELDALVNALTQLAK